MDGSLAHPDRKQHYPADEAPMSFVARAARLLLPISVTLFAAVLLGASGPAVFAQKYGGVLRSTQRETPPSLSIHEEATASTNWPIGPAYNNLVLYDPQRQVESGEHVIGELAESWAWSDAGKRLTFKLHRGVLWHDGKLFTSADVKYTFDLVRAVLPDRKLRTNPRKLWYDNVQEIVTVGDFEVAFVLKRPQPGLISLLGSGLSPIYPAHIEPVELRTREVGTGPFILKEYLPDQRLVLAKNPHYFVKGRPYLDGIEYLIIKDRTARATALRTGQADVSFPGEGTPAIRDQILSSAPQMVMRLVGTMTQDNLNINLKKPPFDNVKIRQAINLAMDRKAILTSVLQGQAILGGANLPPPYGEWGLSTAQLAGLPGYGDPKVDKAEARKLLAEAGYGPNNPLKVLVTTRDLVQYQDMAVWIVAECKEVGIDATLEIVDSTQWYAKLARRDFQIAANVSGIGAEDPDANYFENYSCNSNRNYSDYCDKDAEALMARQSQEQNKAKRLQLVRELDRKLQLDVARPILSHRIDYYLMWPYVKGLVPHNSIYGFPRMQEVWLDK
jgi:peptide/nickel transport system substrate-binding protein